MLWRRRVSSIVFAGYWNYSPARVAIGDVPISGIPFDVQSTIKGINSFGHAVGISDVTVTGSGGAGGNQWITIPLTVRVYREINVVLTHLGSIDKPVQHFPRDRGLGPASVLQGCLRACC